MDRDAPMRLLIGIVFVGFAVLVAGCISPGGPPPSNVTYSAPQLKYVLLDHYNESWFFYCDPDYYPVARGDELEKAVETFPAIENNTALFSAIVDRKGISPPYTNQSKLIIYREYKKLNAIPLIPLTNDIYSFVIQLQLPDGGERVTGVIATNGTILEEHHEDAFLTCPICLGQGTMIDTPGGQVAVEDLAAGDVVWSFDGKGMQVAVPVLMTGKTAVPASHRMVCLRLSDGRNVSVSPGHPTTDGRTIDMLSPGDELDGATVTGVEYAPCTGDTTYDILPAGDTGYYRANRIPLSSTLLSSKMPG